MKKTTEKIDALSARLDKAIANLSANALGWMYGKFMSSDARRQGRLEIVTTIVDGEFEVSAFVNKVMGTNKSGKDWDTDRDYQNLSKAVRVAKQKKAGTWVKPAPKAPKAPTLIYFDCPSCHETHYMEFGEIMKLFKN